MRDVPRRKRERIREGRRRRRSARKTIDKSVSTARIPIASSYAARLTRCLYRGMYNNRLRRWHRCPFVSVGGHLGFSSRGRIRELDRGKAAREKRERDEELLDGRCARFEREAEEKFGCVCDRRKNWEGDVSIGIGAQFEADILSRLSRHVGFSILKRILREKKRSRTQKWPRSDQRSSRRGETIRLPRRPL